MTFKSIDWERVLELSLYLLNGDFIKSYTISVVWRVVTYGAIIVAVFVYVFLPILDLWTGVVNYINYVRWGI